MQLRGPSDGRAGGKRMIPASQSLSLFQCLSISFFLLTPLSLCCPHFFDLFTVSIPCVFSPRLFKQPLSSLPSCSFPVFPSLLVLHVWLLADMHTGSIAHLPNFSSSCLAPTPLLSSSFSLLSPAPCITISRHALRESDEYFSSRREGLQFSASASNTTNGPESVFSLAQLYVAF